MTASQQFLPIEDIKDSLVFLKDGGVSAVISTSAVNFDLLFETEQISIIESFAGLLNSLSFPIQIVIASKRLDVSSYLNTLDQALIKQTNPLLAKMTASYRAFAASIIKENNVLDKQFYVVINVSAMEFGVLPKNITEKSTKAAVLLSPRSNHLIKQLNRLGLKARQLDTSELVNLYYNIYNPPNGDLVTLPKTPPTPQPPTPAPSPIRITRMVPPPPVQPLPKTASVTPVAPAKSGSLSYLTPPFVVEELSDDAG